MKILVFGSTGAFGTALEEVSRDFGFDFVGLGHKDIEITDAKNLEIVVNTVQPDVIVNSVAIIGNVCDLRPQYAFEVNSIPALCLARTCENRRIVFVQLSTHAVFNGEKDGFYTEHDIPSPISTYGISKYAAELFTENNCGKYYIVRFPTMFGPRRNENLGFFDKVLKGIKEKKVLKIALDKIDSPTYTFDAAIQLINIIREKLSYGTYHIANEGSTSYYNFVFEIFRILGKETKGVLREALDADFPSLSPKALKTAMKSEKIDSLRPWKEALREHLTKIPDL